MSKNSKKLKKAKKYREEQKHAELTLLYLSGFEFPPGGLDSESKRIIKKIQKKYHIPYPDLL